MYKSIFQNIHILTLKTQWICALVQDWGDCQLLDSKCREEGHEANLISWNFRAITERTILCRRCIFLCHKAGNLPRKQAVPGRVQLRKSHEVHREKTSPCSLPSPVSSVYSADCWLSSPLISSMVSRYGGKVIGFLPLLLLRGLISLPQSLCRDGVSPACRREKP